MTSATSPSYVPSIITTTAFPAADTDWCGTFRCMASDINLRLGPGAQDPEATFAQVESVFTAVERECTRFDPSSDLMRANRADDWQAVGPYCFAAIGEAAQAHVITSGLFDPRVLSTLCELGYDRSIPFAAGEVALDRPATATAAHGRSTAGWAPGIDAVHQRVHVGPEPIDLGGIGKGLALRWAVDAITSTCPSFVLDAGGDCFLRGDGPDGDGWRVGVEDPRGGEQPVVVLAVSDAACATSSVRLRKWSVGGKPVHHLIDPRTQAPGGAGLLSVTVVDPDPARAEIWSKVLFLHGTEGVRLADERKLSAIWVTEDGALQMSTAAEDYLIWRPS